MIDPDCTIASSGAAVPWWLLAAAATVVVAGAILLLRRRGARVVAALLLLGAVVTVPLLTAAPAFAQGLVRDGICTPGMNITPGPTPVSTAPVPAGSTPPPPTVPPATVPPASTPPASVPPATTPPASVPPATTPPASVPPVTTPPASTPPASTPPATTPPATRPPATTPPPSMPPPTTHPPSIPPAGDPDCISLPNTGGSGAVALLVLGAAAAGLAFARDRRQRTGLAVVCLLAGGFLLVGSPSAAQAADPVSDGYCPTNPTVSPSAVATATAVSASPSTTASPSGSPSATPGTASPTATPSATPSATGSATASPTPGADPSASASPTPGETPGGAVSTPAEPRYVALGDAVAAGVGTSARVDACYRSVLGYPSLLARAAGWKELAYDACTGAVTADVASSQLDHVDASTTHVTLTVGAADVGLVPTILDCGQPTFLGDCEASIASSRELVTGLSRRLAPVYEALRTRAPQADVAVVGYPRPFGGSSCQPLTFFTAAERRALNALVDDLDAALQASAEAHGVRFVDPRAAFAQHATCDASPWIADVDGPVAEAFHPNAAGQAAYARLLGEAFGLQLAPVEATVTRPERDVDYQTVVPELTSPVGVQRAAQLGILEVDLTAVEQDLRSGDDALAAKALTRLHELDRSPVTTR